MIYTLHLHGGKCYYKTGRRRFLAEQLSTVGPFTYLVEAEKSCVLYYSALSSLVRLQESSLPDNTRRLEVLDYRCLRSIAWSDLVRNVNVRNLALSTGAENTLSKRIEIC